MSAHRFSGRSKDLRSPERRARLQVDRVVELSLAGLAAAQAISLLDVGCGTGLFTEAFAQQCVVVAGVDVNPEMIVEAQKLLPSADLRVGQAEELPFDDGAFDLVFMGLVLHEADEPLNALREGYRVARERVVVVEWPYDPDADVGPPLHHRLSEVEIREMAGKAGFLRADSISLEHVAVWLLDRGAALANSEG